MKTQPVPEQSPKTYKFSTFQEMVDRVPGDKLALCMFEMGRMLGRTKQAVEFALREIAARAAQEGQVFEIPEHIIDLPPVFEWIDDGKGECVATLRIDEDCYVKIKA